jgi:hypothetical protein
MNQDLMALRSIEKVLGNAVKELHSISIELSKLNGHIQDLLAEKEIRENFKDDNR